MKRRHLLATDLEPSECRALFDAAKELGLRVGWLDLEVSAPAQPELETAAGAGAFRAVGVAADRVTAVKPVRGPAVLADLLREHFAGCRLVLVRAGGPGLPELVRDGDEYRVRFEDGVEKGWTAAALAKALRKPRLRRLETDEAPPAPSGAR